MMAILAALLLFSHVLAGFRNRDLVELVAGLLDQPHTARQATYDLRRLRRKGLITRLPSQRSQLTSLGRRVAVLFTKTHSRVLAPGLALLDPALPPDNRRQHPARASLANRDGLVAAQALTHRRRCRRLFIEKRR